MLLGPNIAVEIVDKTYIILYWGAPTSDEWSRFLKIVEVSGVHGCVWLIRTDGAEPTTAQRNVLRQLMSNYGIRVVPTAVLTRRRNLGTWVKQWLWTTHQHYFHPEEIVEALQFLGLPRELALSRSSIVARKLQDMQDQIEEKRQFAEP